VRSQTGDKKPATFPIFIRPFRYGHDAAVTARETNDAAFARRGFCPSVHSDESVFNARRVAMTLLTRTPPRNTLAAVVALWGSIIGHAATQSLTPPADRAQLQSIAGDYQSGAIVMTVTLLEDGTLTLFFPGQQLYHLDPQGGLRYRIRELAAGFGVDFVRDAGGTVTGMTVHQPPPQQDFSATRKSGQPSAR
jgi:hypothetical protein